MRKSDLLDKIAPALLAAQKEMGKLVKDKKNDFLKTDYATLGAVLDAVKPVFHKHGISILHAGSPAIDGINTTCLLMHESGQWIELDSMVFSAKKDAQASGSVMTYGRRYSLKNAAALSEEDDDGNSGSNYDPARDRSEDNTRPITAKQHQEINDLLIALGATGENIMTLANKFSGGRTNVIEALMKSEAAHMLPKLRSKVDEKSMV